MIRPLIRPATTTDLPGIAAIYDAAVRTSIATFDVELRPRSYWEARLGSAEPGDHLLVAVSDTAWYELRLP